MQTISRITRRLTLGVIIMSSAVISARAQTTATLLNETFETSSPTAGSWTMANGSYNKWYIGTGTCYAGSQSAYISSSSNSYGSYSKSSSAVNHLYTTVTLPASTLGYTLTFRWKCTGEGNYDNMKVYLLPSSVTPSAGSNLGVSYSSSRIGSEYYSGSSSWQSATITIPASSMGTRKLVFQWQNDGIGGGTNGAAIDNVSISYTPLPDKTVDLSTAGTLSSKFASEEQTLVTKLTVTGSINAVDVKFMRDNLTNLDTLDLSWATIDEYTGTDGTVSTSTTYPANTMPTYSFYNGSTGTAKTALRMVKLPVGLTAIGEYAFANCSGLKGLQVFSNTPLSINSNVFDEVTLGEVGLSVPEGAESAYATADVWKEFGTLDETNIVTSGTCGAEQDGKNLTWVLTCDSVLTISGTGEMKNYLFSTRPPWYAYRSQLKTLIIENGVTIIGSNAFEDCSGFTGTLTIPESVTNIGILADCIGLTAINVSASNEHYSSIDGVLFDKKQTTLIQYPGAKQGNFTILGNIWSLYYGCFDGCTGIDTLHVPWNAPLNASFKGANVSGSVLEIPLGCRSNYAEAYGWNTFGVIIESSKSGIYVGQCGRNLHWTLSADSVLTISGTGDMWDFEIDEAQWHSKANAIKTVIIGEGATSIGNMAFEDCSRLTSVSIPYTVTKIGDVFDGCLDLTAINVDAANTNYSSEGGVLFNKDKTCLITYPSSKAGESYTIPNSVEFVEGKAFSVCKNLVTVNIPGSVEKIDGGNFISSPKLTGISVNAANEYYVSEGDVLFNKNKTELVCYPAGRQGNYTIPVSVTSIGSAFNGCTGIDTLRVSWSSPVSASFSNSGLSSSVLVVPFGSRSRYAVASGWMYFGTIVEPDEVGGKCGDNLWWELTKEGVLSISGTGDMWDFDEDEGAPWYIYRDIIKVLNIGNGITSIGDYAFAGCYTIVSITIPGSVTYINEMAFDDMFGTFTMKVAWHNPYHFEGGGFDADLPNCTLIVPDGRISAYDTAAVWKEFGDIRDSLTVEHGTCGTGLTWRLGTDGMLYISGTGNMTDYSSSSHAPWYDYRDQITAISVEAAVQEIGDYAFAGCSKMQTFVNARPVPHAIKTNVFDGVDIALCTLYVDVENVDRYKAATVWKGFGYYRAIGSDAQLASLRVEGHTISPVFTPSVTAYTVTVPYIDSVIVVSATATLGTVIGTGSKSLMVSSNTFHIVAKSPDARTKTYTLTVTRQARETASSNADLSSLEVSGYTFVPAFNPAVTAYTLTVPTGATHISIAATAADAANGAQVAGTGVKTLQVGANDFSIVVVAGNAKSYTLTITRSAPSELPVDVNPSDTEATISWGSVEGAAAYTLIVYADEARTQAIDTIHLDAQGNRRAKAVAPTLTYTLTGLEASSTYYYKLLAADISGTTLSMAVGSLTTTETGTSETVAVTGVSLDRTTLTLAIGEQQTLRATVLPANATNKAILWANNNPQVASIENGVVTAKTAGTATITVTTSDGGYTATCTVTVTTTTETGVDDVETHGRASLHTYPNPTSGELRIKNSRLRAGDAIELFTATGQRIAIFTATGEETIINLDRFAAGVYVVKIGEWSDKIVKE